MARSSTSSVRTIPFWVADKHGEGNRAGHARFNPVLEAIVLVWTFGGTSLGGVSGDDVGFGAAGGSSEVSSGCRCQGLHVDVSHGVLEGVRGQLTLGCGLRQEMW